MIHSHLKFPALALLACLCTGAHAVELSDVSWGADLGTTGIGLQARLPLSLDNRLYGRLGIHYLSRYSLSKSTSQVNYDFKASLKTVDALLDWHPAGNGFRLTAGAIYNKNVLDAIGVPNRVANFTFENASYSTSQVGKVVGRIDFADFAPYLGIGWQSLVEAERGWSLSSDLGVMYQGSPRTSLGVGGCTLPASLCSIVVTALAPTISAETQRLNDELKTYRFFPVARVGLNYRF